MGIGLPPPRGTYKWAIQSVAVHGSKSGKKYSSFYYEVATGRSVEEPLSLPAGGEIVGVFPDDVRSLYRTRPATHLHLEMSTKPRPTASARGYGLFIL